MARRDELQAILEGLFEENPHVYFQPPTGLEVTYPAIIYALDQEAKAFADNAPYRTMKRYQVTVISGDPDSNLPDKVSALPLTSFVRHFTTQSLYHNIYTLYF